MEYRCISADGHIDLLWLPHDLFVSNASRAMKERMPYVVEAPDGARWVTKTGLNFGFANAKGGIGAAGNTKKYIKRQFSHLPSATQRKLTCENVGKFYGLIPG